MSLTKTQHYTLRPSGQKQSSEHFELIINNYETACSLALPRQSEYYTVILITSGRARYSIDFHEFEIDGAGLFCISPGQIVSMEHESILEAYQIHFNREFYCVETHGKEIACNGKLFNNVHRTSYIPLSLDTLPAFSQIFTLLKNEMMNPGTAHRDIVDSYLRLILIEALRHSPQEDDAIHFDPKKSSTSTSFIALVDKHFREKHTVQEYADLLFMTARSLAKRLKSDGYGTPLELIRERIVLEAKRELRYSDRSIKEISFDLGFDDPSYFTRYFKKTESMSPAAYREQYLN